jgi:hypothetical protein
MQQACKIDSLTSNTGKCEDIQVQVIMGCIEPKTVASWFFNIVDTKLLESTFSSLEALLHIINVAAMFHVIANLIITVLHSVGITIEAEQASPLLLGNLGSKGAAFGPPLLIF